MASLVAKGVCTRVGPTLLKLSPEVDYRSRLEGKNASDGLIYRPVLVIKDAAA